MATASDPQGLCTVMVLPSALTQPWPPLPAPRPRLAPKGVLCPGAGEIEAREVPPARSRRHSPALSLHAPLHPSETSLGA